MRKENKMDITYSVCYYMNKIPKRYDFIFTTAFGAIFTARSIFERFGLATDVMDNHTGEIIAIFEPDNIYVSSEIDDLSRVVGEMPVI